MDKKNFFSFEIVKMAIAYMVGFIIFGLSQNMMAGIATLAIYGFARIVDEIKKLQ